MAMFTLRRRRPPSLEESFERALVSPLVLTHPGARAIYWSVFALLLLSTLITFGPLYWMFSSALKSSIEIFQTPPTIWPLHPAWSNYSNAWSVLHYPLYFGNTPLLPPDSLILHLPVSATPSSSFQ